MFQVITQSAGRLEIWRRLDSASEALRESRYLRSLGAPAFIYPPIKR